MLLLPVQHISCFGPSIVWVHKQSIGRQLFSNHAVQWLVVVTTMLIDCPMCFKAYLCMSQGEKKRMQLRVANHVPLVRNNDSFFYPWLEQSVKALVTK